MRSYSTHLIKMALTLHSHKVFIPFALRIVMHTFHEAKQYLENKAPSI